MRVGVCVCSGVWCGGGGVVVCRVCKRRGAGKRGVCGVVVCVCSVGVCVYSEREPKPI